MSEFDDDYNDYAEDVDEDEPPVEEVVVEEESVVVTRLPSGLITNKV